MKYSRFDCLLAFDTNLIDSDDFIYFWKHDVLPIEKTYACFSQWFPSAFEVDGITYCNAEQYMMAEKARFFGDEETLGKILVEMDPKRIKALGREVKGFDAKRWASIAEEVVKTGNLNKFEQNTLLLKILLGTERKTLLEASPYDSIWGIGMAEDEARHYGYPHVWKGENKLGFILMEVRDLLREKGCTRKSL